MEGVSFFESFCILYFENENNYTCYIFNNHKPIMISKTLDEFEEILSNHGFIRLHKSFFVNKKYITKLNREGMGWMSDGKALAVLRRRREV